jgi:type IV pilus assembly protein PilN
MKITLNLATRPFVDLGPILRQLRIGMGVLAALAAIFALGLHLVHGAAEQARQRDHALDGQIARITQERQGDRELMARPENARLVAETAALNELFEQKAFSWTLTLENLERALPAGVQVVTLEPAREKDGRITVHLRVAGPRDRVEELVRALERSERFRNPRIVGESAEQSAGFNLQRQEPVSPQNRFTFDIFADYNPPAAGEHRTASGKPEASHTEVVQTAEAKPEAGHRPAAKSHPATGGAR